MKGSGNIGVAVFAAMLTVMKAVPQKEKIIDEGGMASEVQMLGAFFDLDRMRVSVPMDKTMKAKHLIAVVCDLAWAPADLMQQLLGVLVFLCRILLSAKWHLSATVRASAVAGQEGVVRVRPMLRSELQWHNELYTHWNCAAMMIPRQYTTWDQHTLLTPASDAAASKKKRTGAAGAWFSIYYQYWDFTAEEASQLDIMDLEGLALVVWMEYLVRIHPQYLTGKRFVMRCDNDPFVVAVNSRKSSQPAVAYLLGILHRWQALYSFDLRLVYIKSKDNIGADALSRGKLTEFFSFMLSRFDISQGKCRRVPLNNELRNLTASTMLRSKRSTTYGQRPPRAEGGRRSEFGSGSVFDTNSNLC